MPRSRTLQLHFPLGGLWKRTEFERIGPYHTPDCLNVRSDAFAGRERGGSRPALRKTEGTPMGDEVRLLHPLTFVSSEINYTKMMAVCNGKVWYEHVSTGIMTAAGNNGLTNDATLFAKDRLLHAGEHRQLLYVADYGGLLDSGTDGAFESDTGVFTSSGSLFDTSISDVEEVLLEITGQTGLKQNEIIKIETFGTPTSGTFKLRFGGLETSVLNHTATAADINTALEVLASIAVNDITDNAATLPAAVTLEFGGSLAGKDLSRLGPFVSNNSLIESSGGPAGITITRTQHGGQEAALNARYRVTIETAGAAVIDGGDFGLTFNGDGTFENQVIYKLSGFARLTGGSYRITLGGEMTDTIFFDGANDADYNTMVENRLYKIFPKREYEVVVTGKAVTGTGPGGSDDDNISLAITHKRKYHKADETKRWVSIDFGDLTPPPDAADNEPLVFSATAAGGDGTIDWEAPAATVEAELELLSTIGEGNVSVSGNNDAWIVEFINDLAGEAGNGTFTGDNTGLTDGGVENLAHAIKVEQIQEGGAAGSTARFSAVGVYPILIKTDTTLTLDPVKAILPEIDYANLTWRIFRAMKHYSPDTDTIAQWVSTPGKGSVPAGRPIFCIWRDCAVLAGGLFNTQQVLISRQGQLSDGKTGLDDWDYSAEDSGRPLVLTAEKAGAIGEKVTALLPLNEEVLLIFCTSSTWIVRGDPRVGGRITPISSRVGAIDSGAWCVTPNGWVYFLSRDGLYVFAGGNQVHSISRKKLPEDLLNIDTAAKTVLLAYDLRHRGIHLYVTTNVAGTDSTDNYWLDLEQTISDDEPVGRVAFFPVSIPNEIDPFCLAEHDDTASSQSVVWHGSRDGIARNYNYAEAQQDEGTSSDTDITSYVLVGPFRLGPVGQIGTIRRLQAALPTADEGDVSWDLLIGATAQDAAVASSAVGGTWTLAGLNHASYPNRSAYAACLKLSNGDTAPSTKWAVEQIEIDVLPGGVRRVMA